jgi:hypothetical protein
MQPNTETRIDLVLYDLERLGFWLEAEEAECRWEVGRVYNPPYDADIPIYVRQEIWEVNDKMN